GQTGAVTQQEARQQADGPLLARHAGGRGCFPGGNPQCTGENAQVGDCGDVQQDALAQRIEVAGLAPEGVGGRVEHTGCGGQFGAPQAEAVDHAPGLAGQHQVQDGQQGQTDTGNQHAPVDP